MVSRRYLLRLTIGGVISVLASTESITGVQFSGISDARETKKPRHGMTLESWMKDWMDIYKTPGGMLKVSRFRDPIYFLIAPISWEPNPGQEGYEAVTVPFGFVTDFASIPRVFWSVLPPDGTYAYAAVVHDYLYWTQTRPKKEADQILKMAMEDFEVGTTTVGTIYKAVRLAGQMAWNENAGKKAKGEKRVLRQLPQDPRMTWKIWSQRPENFE
mgnify:CR=1 FL=1